MDGTSYVTQADRKAATYEREAAAYEREYGARIGQAVSGSDLRSREATITGLVQSTDELCGLLAELGSRMERVETIIAGPPGPGEPASAKERPSEGSVTDVLDGGLSRARMMVSRLHDKMSRIERRIG